MIRTFEILVTVESRSLETCDEAVAKLKESLEHYGPDQLTLISVESKNDNLERMKEIL